jgi:hypothetical protein
MEMATVDKTVQESVNKSIKRLCKAVTIALESNVDSSDQAEALSNSIICSYFGARVLAKAGAPVPMIIGAQTATLRCLVSR